MDPQLLVQTFVYRIKRHVSLLQSLVLTVTDFRLSGGGEDNPGVVGDRFGLRKVVRLDFKKNAPKKCWVQIFKNCVGPRSYFQLI